MRDDLDSERYKANGQVAHYTKERADELLFKKRATLTCIHPDTGEVIKFFGRASAFVPANMPIICAMMLSPPSTKSTIFWQWVNQTYNAGFNYGNRNASQETDMGELL
jgi:sideroflexin-5